MARKTTTKAAKPEPQKRPVGRPKGSKNANKAAAATPGHNNTLTDEQQQVLFHQHRRQIKAAIEELESAKGRLRNLYSRAKAEGFPKSDFDFAKALENDRDNAAIEKRRREANVARWMGHAIGTQPDLFEDVDRTPVSEKAFDAGKRAGLAGETLRAPEGYGSGTLLQEYTRGWHEGQSVHLSTIKSPLETAASTAAAAENRKQVAAEKPDEDAFGEGKPTKPEPMWQ